MPVLTRSAARQLGEESKTSRLGLREPVTSKASAVWEYMEGKDIYTNKTRQNTSIPQVDHLLEIQLSEMALVRALADTSATTTSMATAQTTDMLRHVINGNANLNVTSARVNQAKRGPFTAAMNRIRSDRFRTVEIEQLVRQGKGKWLIDDGTWAKINRSVVQSYDQVDEDIRGGGIDALPEAARLVNASLDELGAILGAIGMQS